ncbi:hypothetical protein Ahy_A05g025627 [Arachis hypogaea]|uniref:Uncharacterized protein n=1 Tax=Arachis hypogaea TaxID=3818 RepID=A0A445D947_ARAHY|nr:hypothetical protein Ahy_A05g025627 [Arachis hypogaea]
MIATSQHCRLKKISRIVCRELIEITRDSTLIIAPNLRPSIVQSPLHCVFCKIVSNTREVQEKCDKSVKTAVYPHWRFEKPGSAEGRRGSVLFYSLFNIVLLCIIHSLDYLCVYILPDCVDFEQEGRIVGRGELWIKVHKRRDGSYINDEAREIGERLLEIEQHDESSRVLSQNDSLAQVFGREKPGRVRGVGFGPTPSQLFGTNLQPSVNRVQVEEMQRKLNELQTELEAEKLKRKAMKDEAAADNKRIKGEELPPEIAAEMCSTE